MTLVSSVKAARRKLAKHKINLSREYNSRDLNLPLYNRDYNKRGLCCGHINGNLDLMGVTGPE